MILESPYQQQTRLGTPKNVLLFIYIFAAGLGSAIGYFLTYIMDWVLLIPFIPFTDIITYFLQFDGPLALSVRTLLGLIAGLICARWAIGNLLTITVSGREIILDKNKVHEKFHKDKIRYIFTDKTQLVIIGQSGAELIRIEHDEDTKDLAEAFQMHGFPWTEQDPYQDQYRRFIPNMPDLPIAVNAVMKARKKAIEDDEQDDMDDYRKDLEKLGFVVRDEKHKQFWRRLDNERSQEDIY